MSNDFILKVACHIQHRVKVQSPAMEIQCRTMVAVISHVTPDTIYLALARLDVIMVYGLIQHRPATVSINLN